MPVEALWREIGKHRTSISLGELVHLKDTFGASLLPLVVEPTEDGIVLADWNAKNREWVEAQLLVHGGVLFRNFTLPSPADFERAAKAIYGELFGDYW